MPAHLAFAIVAAAAHAHALQLPALPRYVSYVAGALGDVEVPAREMLTRQGDVAVPLDEVQRFGGDAVGGELEAARLARAGAAEWVHVATTFAELVEARRAGATTVWLNEQAAGSAGDLEEQGYFGTAIIDDFADAVIGGAIEVPGVLDEARDARRRREAKDEQARLVPTPLNNLERVALGLGDGQGPTSRFAGAAAAPSTPTSPLDDDGGRAQAIAQPTAPLTKYCMECGTELPRSAKFCKRCGEPQPQEEAQDAL